MSHPSQPRPRPQGWYRGTAAAFLVLPLVTALLLRPGAGTGRLVGLMLLAEPLAIGLATYLLLWLLGRRWWLASLTLTTSTVAAVALLHAPGTPGPPSDITIPWAEQVQACTAQNELPNAPLRVLSWNASDVALDADALDQIVDMRPDLAVVSGLRDERFLERLSDLLPGKTLAFGGAGDMVGLYVRGVFQDCGAGEDAWPLSVFGQGEGLILTEYALDQSDQDLLPADHAARRTLGQLVFAFPRVQGVGTVPMVAFQLPVQASRMGSEAWPAAVHDGARVLAAASLLGGPSLIAAGHLGVPHSFQHTIATLEGSGLRDAGGPPTWPTHLMGVPFLPIHRLDRVLSGSGWRVRSTETAASKGGGSHQPLLVQLERTDDDAPFGLGETHQGP